MFRNLSLSGLLIASCTLAFAQVNLINVTPLSPNAAAIARYGETSVGHFTGVPNISIPIHTITSDNLNLSLTLSYHAGGVKVEDIASWVGLGWSLSGIPVISRSVRTLPDEGTAAVTHGYFNKFLGETIAECQDPWPSQFTRYVYNGEIDGEPDIFSLSLSGKSVKFFYNQQEEKFLTIPLSNIKIEHLSGAGFIVTDDNGDVYYFNERETSSTTASVSTAPVPSSWWVSKIVNLNRTDSIVFNYETELQIMTQIAPIIQYISGPCQSNIPAGSLTTTTSVSSKKISSIDYRGGSVSFVTDTANRLDVGGGHALSKIQIGNNYEVLKSFEFNFSYSTSQSGGGYCDNTSLKRLILNSVTEFDADGIAQNPHRFEYISPSSLPCRLSFAQDYWGFYNGANSNTSLVPAFFRNTVYGPVEISGADRNVKTDFSRYGTLNKIYYPTGGSSEFIYENNEVVKGLVPTNYTLAYAALDGEGIPTTDYYSVEFEIDNLADPILNGSLGGAFVDIHAGYFGCDLSSGPDNCATIGITRIDPASPAIYVPITGNHSNIYLPNGTYKLEASFDQDPAEYGSFFAAVEWKVDASSSNNSYVGGLRVKEIRTNDGNLNSDKIIRRFYYTNPSDTTRSSGNVFGISYFNHFEENIISWDFEQCMRVLSRPNSQGVTHSGSYVGYVNVTEEYAGLNNPGKTEYTFTSASDDGGGSPFPYVPEFSYEHFRGQPLTTTYYSREGSEYFPVKKITYAYLDSIFTATDNSSFISGIYDLAPLSPDWPEPEPVAIAPYEMVTGWSAPLWIKETIYDQHNNSIVHENKQEFEYTKLQITNTKTLSSSGQFKETRNYYPFNISPTPSELLEKNNLLALIRKETYTNSLLTETIDINYVSAVFAGRYLTVPASVSQQIGDGEHEIRIEYNKYNSIGRIIDQKKSDDVPLSYIWDEVHGLLLAEVTNATSDNIYHSSFEVSGTSETVSNPAHTGTRYLNTGSYNFSSNGFVPGSTTNLKMSYWYWSSSKWNFSGIVNWSNTISAGTRLDEIRVFPAEAQMITYTHAPGIGITSQTDANNVTMYYEYDSFGRLKWLRDKDKNIVKRIDYHYRKTN